MKGIAFLLSAFLCAVSFAAMPLFPYGTETTVRHQTSEPVEIDDSSYAVPAVGGGMPASDTVATTCFEIIEMEEVPADSWDWASACAEGGQAALCIKEKEDRSLVWMGYSNGTWAELVGAADPKPGAWEVRMDFDYTQGTSLVRVRYSVRPGGSTGDYVVLQPTEATSPWMETGVTAGKRIASVELHGWCDLTFAAAESGQRQGYAETATVEDYRMDYSGVMLDVVVDETWGVDTLVATVKDMAGNVKGIVSNALASAQDGKVRLDLSDYTRSGESYVYDLKLTGAYGGVPVTCEKGETKFDLFSMASWFGFDGAALVKAVAQGLTVSGGLLSATNPNAKGDLSPEASEPESVRTMVEATIAVPGAVPHWELSALPVAGAQGALVMAQFGGSVGRSWVVWSATAGDWVAVSGAGVGTENGSYDVRAEFDEISSARSVRYSVKVDSDYVVLKDGGAAEWFALPPAATRLNRVSLSGAGGISRLEASYKALGPVQEVTVKDGKIELTSNTELDLTKSALETDKGYPVQNPPGKKFHLRWKDAKSGDATTKWAKVENGQLKAVAGAPANGLESFDSYALGLDPTVTLAKPAAVVKAGGMQSADGVTVHVPNVVPANLPASGVTVVHRLQRSADKGQTWTDTGTEVGAGETLVVPFESGVLYRVNTVLK